MYILIPQLPNLLWKSPAAEVRLSSWCSVPSARGLRVSATVSLNKRTKDRTQHTDKCDCFWAAEVIRMSLLHRSHSKRVTKQGIKCMCVCVYACNYLSGQCFLKPVCLLIVESAKWQETQFDQRNLCEIVTPKKIIWDKEFSSFKIKHFYRGHAQRLHALLTVLWYHGSEDGPAVVSTVPTRHGPLLAFPVSCNTRRT